MSSQIPTELLEQVFRGNCILFLGPEILSGGPDEQGLPTRKSLTGALLERFSYPEDDIKFNKVSQYYEMEYGRQALLQFIIDVISNYKIESLLPHRLVIRLPIRTIVTTNYDQLLERELERRNKSYVRVVGNEEIAYLDESKVLLIKMHGTIETPSSMIVTEDDILEFFTKLPAISIVLKALFATRTLLFIGYDLSDTNFKRLYTEITTRVDRHKRRAYVIQENPKSYDLKWWGKRNVEIIQDDICDFLLALDNKLNVVSDDIDQGTLDEPLPNQPYKFLDYFEERDAPVFFGRDQEVSDMSKHILAHKISVLYGSSGTGKTSLILAGIIPNLAKEGYQCVYSRTLKDPELAIKEKISTKLTNNVNIISLRKFFENTLPLNSRWVIFLDQFEEFFIRQGAAVRKKFAQTLIECLQIEKQDIRFVISIRDDYFVRLDELESCLPTIFVNKYRLENLDANRTRMAIVEPAQFFGVDFSPNLVERIIDDLRGGGYEPTQIQIVCHKLYETYRKETLTFTLEGYRQLGYAEGILARYLDDVLSMLQDDNEREIARGVLKSMVTAEATKEALSAKEIARDSIVRKLSVSDEKVTRVLEELRNNRIIRKLADPELYELSHEVLVKKVWEWVSQEDIVHKYTRTIIRQALADWQQIGVSLDLEKWQLINDQREIISVSHEELELILRSSIYRREETDYWFIRAIDAELNVWEWTSTRATDDEDRFYKYPYDSSDGREKINVKSMRVVRGGSFNYSKRASRCSARAWRNSEYRSWHYGFRVVHSKKTKEIA